MRFRDCGNVKTMQYKSKQQCTPDFNVHAQSGRLSQCSNTLVHCQCYLHSHYPGLWPCGLDRPDVSSMYIASTQQQPALATTQLQMPLHTPAAGSAASCTS